MAAPARIVRDEPTIAPMKNGFGTFIAFENATDLNVWEKTAGVTPPGADGGPAVATDTMWNERWKTIRPSALMTPTESRMTVAYDPSAITEILAQINQEQAISSIFSNGGAWSYYGYLKSFIPNELKDTEQPTAVMVIQQTNWDPINDVEEDPVYYPPA